MEPALDPQDEPSRRDRLMANFAWQYGAREANFSSYCLARMLRATGERPSRVAEMKALLCELGLGDPRWITTGGVFRHGSFWAVAGLPRILVGEPYHLTVDERAKLATLARFPVLSISIDDRPSCYGFGTHHVRIEVRHPQKPFKAPRATRATRAYAHAARRAFAQEFAAPE